MFHDSQSELKQAMPFSHMEEKLFPGLVHIAEVLETGLKPQLYVQGMQSAKP